MVKTPLEKDVFVRNNLGLVHSCANRFRGRGAEYDDLFGAGCVGLLKAIDGFDETRGIQFSTYAVPVAESHAGKGTVFQASVPGANGG